MVRVTGTWLLCILAVLNFKAVVAYDVPTHSAIATRAVQPTVSVLDRVLKTDLGFSGGISQQFLERSVRELVEDGARFEDAPSLRVLNHFHNPLRPWSQAGLFLVNNPSVRWAQTQNQAFSILGGSWSWQEARDRFLAGC